MENSKETQVFSVYNLVGGASSKGEKIKKSKKPKIVGKRVFACRKKKGYVRGNNRVENPLGKSEPIKEGSRESGTLNLLILCQPRVEIPGTH